MNDAEESIDSLRDIVKEGNLLHVERVLSSDDVGMDENGVLIDISNKEQAEKYLRRKKAVIDGNLTLEEANKVFNDGNF